MSSKPKSLGPTTKPLLRDFGLWALGKKKKKMKMDERRREKKKEKKKGHTGFETCNFRPFKAYPEIAYCRNCREISRLGTLAGGYVSGSRFPYPRPRTSKTPPQKWPFFIILKNRHYFRCPPPSYRVILYPHCERLSGKVAISY